MKLGMSMYSVVGAVRSGEIDVPGFIEYGAAQGLDGVELLHIFWETDKPDWQLVKRQAADAGLEIVSYSASNDFVYADADERQRQLEHLKRCVDGALELGAGLVRVFGGSARDGIAQADGMAMIIEGLAAGAAYAEDHGLTLALENHGRFAGRADQVRAIIEPVGSPALRVNFDTGNFLITDEDPLSAAHDLADLIALVHLKDMKAAAADEPGHVFVTPGGKRLTGATLGDGLVDLPAVVAFLREAGYTGWLSLEYEGYDDAMTLGVPRSLAHARSLLG